jgi:hypothetical protein
MKLLMNKILRFWVECDYEQNRGQYAGRKRAQAIASILAEFEAAGDAMR